jgi:hypothetical protein
MQFRHLLPLLARSLVAIVIEVLDRAAQEGPRFVEMNDFKPAHTLAHDIHAAVFIGLQQGSDLGSAAYARQRFVFY